jgi:antitoxin component of RelBE/YafQ-DinJ toxin-antitoxin module
MAGKQQANFRLTDEEHRLLKASAEKIGLSRTAVIKLALRKLAQREKVK